METDIVRSDVQTVGNEIKDASKKSIMLIIKQLIKLLKDLFKGILSDYNKTHTKCSKLVDKDGKTKERDKISGLTYEETQDMCMQYVKDGVPLQIIDERGKQLNDKQKLNDIQSFTETRQNLEKAKEKLKAKPNNISRINKVDILQKKYDKQVNKYKGMTFSIITNKSQQGYNNERRIEIIERRTQMLKSKFADNFKNNGETKVYDETKFNDFLQKCKEEGKLAELNEVELAEMFNSLHKEGTVETSKFEKNYAIHTVDAATGAKITTDLNNEGIEFAVEHSTVDNNEVVRIYINEDDVNMYNSNGYSQQGSIEHIGNNSKKESSFDYSSSQSISIPLSKIQEMNRLLKDEEYKFMYDVDDTGQKVGVYTVTESAAQRAYNKEYNSNPVQETIDLIKQQEQEKSNTTNKTNEYTLATMDINNDKNTNIDVDIDVDIDIDKE